MKCYKKKEMNLLDIHFAMIFKYPKYIDNLNISVLFASIISLSLSLGNICIPISKILDRNLFSEYILKFLYFFFNEIYNLNKCLKYLFKINLISNSIFNLCTPFIIYNDCIYTYKYWLYEDYVVSYFNKNINKKTKLNKVSITILEKYFYEFNFDIYQKFSVLSSVINKISIISGGPGTGKTTLIAKLLIILYEIYGFKDKECIKIVCPTGKSASCLTYYLCKSYKILGVNKLIKKILPDKAITIHKLLKFNYTKNSIFYNINNKILLDILIIDESSMVDLYTFYSILLSLDNNIKIILIGDSNQIGSIEPCSVFNELCNFNFLNKFLVFKRKIIQYFLKINKKMFLIFYNFSFNIIFLNKEYRFCKNSFLSKFSKFVKLGEIKKIDFFLENFNFSKNFNFYDFDKFNYDFFLNYCYVNYNNYINKFEKSINLNKLNYYFNKFQLICILRDSKYGVIYLNKIIDNYFLKKISMKNNVFFDKKNNYYYYHGKPIILLRNNNSLKLYNGDLGFWILKNKKFKIFFKKNDDFIIVYPNNLYKWENVWAITVHKSQGSEFDHVLLVIPDYINPLLNRKLIYTAITRCKKKLTIFSKKEIFLYGINSVNNYFNNFEKKIFKHI